MNWSNTKLIAKITGIAFLFLCWTSCESDVSKEKSKDKPYSITSKRIQSPEFNPDSAYLYIEKQVDFGPRVPNTTAHEQCAQYLENKLKSFGWETNIQEGEMRSMNRNMPIKNILARYNPKLFNRVVLFAHWDSRYVADRDNKDKERPILGANDGGSGVGVLLEIARVMSLQKEQPNIGVDIVLLDAEDQGLSSDGYQSWCLGAQYWASHIPFEKGYNPKYGILLDMVGAEDAVFPKEGHSMKYAQEVVNDVWNAAASLGYSKYFVHKVQTTGWMGDGLTDDHLFINTMANIPTIDIVHYDVDKADFGPFHHRHSDNMDIIHKPTLKAVGQTVLEVIYNER